MDGEVVALGADGRPDFFICCRTFAPPNRALSTLHLTSSFLRGEAS